MKKIVLSAFLLAGLMFTSCKDDDNKIDEGTVDISKMYLPLKITADDYTTNYTYNNKGQLTKIVESDGYEYTFAYSGNQLTSFVEIDSGTKTTYTFSQSGNIITVNLVGEVNGETLNDTHTLEVDAKGNLINDGYFIYTYDANGNNVIVEAENGDGIANLTFDTKNNVFKNLNLPKWVSNYLSLFNSGSNNSLTFSFVSTEYPEDNNSGTMTYEYNADGYPTKATATSTDDTGTYTDTQTIEYTKK
ncbi:RHS repeat protein [Flavobacterium dauae]|uniref:RHS repeat protein n=1 Tax=Flavobacterium dauae TaxID=1563479 RepID=UPI00101B26B1|nr:RHS repeat protein [Flavobacterium dauae]WLD24447.1 RHS repeat protein [Flavobacterium dauae]